VAIAVTIRVIRLPSEALAKEGGGKCRWSLSLALTMRKSTAKAGTGAFAVDVALDLLVGRVCYFFLLIFSM
jgi:hypothetical protein